MFVLIVPSTLSSGVIESQIIGMVHGLYTGVELTVLFVGKGAKKKQTLFSVKYPDICFESNTTWLLRVRREVTDIYSRSIIHYFSLYFFRALFCRSVVLHYDFRGLISEESYLRNKNKMRCLILKVLEWVAFKTADKLYAVSNNLERYLHSRFGGSRSIRVIPCCIELSEIRLKSSFVSTDSCVQFIYIGSMSKWQGFDRVCIIFKKLQKLMPCHLSVVTRDTELAISILEEYNIMGYRLLSGDRLVVFDALARADFGFLFREANIVNETASPIKFIEYTSQGVIPLITNAVGDYSDLALRAKIALGLEDEVSVLVNNILGMLQDPSILNELHDFSLAYSWDKYLVDID